MSDIFLRNIDLMNHSTTRADPRAVSGPTMRASRFLWDDFALATFTPRKLRQNPLPFCTSITIQFGYEGVLAGVALMPPLVGIRDANVAPANPNAIVNGIEIVQGDWVTFATEEGENCYLDPSSLWLFFYGTVTATIHVCYGVLQ